MEWIEKMTAKSSRIASTPYFIRDGYHINKRAKKTPYLCSEDDASYFQVDVYRFAKVLIVEKNIRSVLDIGCGFGNKLQKFIMPVCKDITGIDSQYCIDHCKRTHQFGTWIVDDIENSHVHLPRVFDLILCADVIEHLLEPNNLLDYIRRCSDSRTLIVLSTPERDKVAGGRTMGPPVNPAHVREWNASEFHNYVEWAGFEIIDHHLVRGNKLKISRLVRDSLGFLFRGRPLDAAYRVLSEFSKSTQVVLCRIIQTGHRS